MFIRGNHFRLIDPFFAYWLEDSNRKNGGEEVHGNDGDEDRHPGMRGVVQQSRDHTEVRALLDAGKITVQEAENWPRKNVITRAIGVTATPECDIVSGQLEPGDYFMLCSDGLNEHIGDAEIADYMRRLPPQAACDAMIRETLARGARDNVTVIAVRCMPSENGAQGLDDVLDDLL